MKASDPLLLKNSASRPVLHLSLKANPLLLAKNKTNSQKNLNENKKLFISFKSSTSVIDKTKATNLRHKTTLACNSLQFKTYSGLHQESTKSSYIMSMLQKNYLMSTVIQGRQHKLFQMLSTGSCSLCERSSTFQSVVNKNLGNRYYMKQESYNAKVISDVMINECTHFVSIFKDYLIFDDVGEFLTQSYGKKGIGILKKLIQFYDRCTHPFPNYTALMPECKLLYRNIEEKQKFIDECNKTKRSLNQEKTLFNTRFISEINNLNKGSEKSLKMPDLLEAFISKDMISQFDVSHTLKCLNDITLSKEPSMVSEVKSNPKPKIELKLSRNLATRLGFKTNRDEVMVTPMEVITKMSVFGIPGRSSILHPKNSYNLTNKVKSSLKKFDTVDVNKKNSNNKGMHSKKRALRMGRDLILSLGTQIRQKNMHGIKDNRRNTIKPKAFNLKLAHIHPRSLHKTGKSQPDLMKVVTKKELMLGKESIKELIQEKFKTQLIQELRNKPLKPSRSLGNFKKKRAKP